MATTEAQLLTVLRDKFGHQSFRGKQADVIASTLSGRDTVCISPTSSGKSLNFQLPALILPGVTVVVSPLIALMKDQVDSLTAKGIPATFLNSSLGQAEYDERMDNLLQGVYKLLYVAPERFSNQRFMEAMGEVNVSLFAVDEAHCFTAETIVQTPHGGRAISSIAIGDEVLSSEDGRITKRRVVSKFIHRGSDIWKLRVNGRDIYCDAGQRFFVKDTGFIRVDQMSTNQEVLILEKVQQIHVHQTQAAGISDHHLPDVRRDQKDAQAKNKAAEQVLLAPVFAQGVPQFGQNGAACVQGLPDMPQNIPDQTRLQDRLLLHQMRTSVEAEVPRGIRKNEGAQSDVHPRHTGNSVKKNKGDRQTKEKSWWKRPWPIKSRGPAGKGWKLHAKPHHTDGALPGWEWIPVALQARLGVAYSKSGCGGGRQFTRLQNPPRARQAQGAVSAFARVESVSRVQRGCVLGCGERLGENQAGVLLYDIEVEGSHNFFANGVLAHNCVSQWGHDFRPEYMKLDRAIAAFGSPPVMALTATATPDVRDDVIKQLGLRDPKIFASGFERTNLSLEVKPVSGTESKLFHVCQEIGKWQTGIVYCATRKNVELVTARLQQMRVRCLCYHGGIKDEERTLLQQRFMEGTVPVAVATNAFGMGIDRSDLRFIVHYDIPGSVEALFQECGRAGRDGKDSHCLLLYSHDSVETQKFFIEGSNPTRDAIQYVYDTVQRLCRFGPVNLPIDKIAEQVREVRNPMAVGTALKMLERHGAIRRWRGEGQGRAYCTDLKKPVRKLDQLGIDFASLNAKRVRDMARLGEMVRYADQFRKCRQGYILEYFGEEYRNCGRCDICRARRS